MPLFFLAAATVTYILHRETSVFIDMLTSKMPIKFNLTLKINNLPDREMHFYRGFLSVIQVLTERIKKDG